jgi:hypothetical protein
MGAIQSRVLTALGLVAFAGCGLISKYAMAEDMSEPALETRESGLANSTVVNLAELTAKPSDYDFFTFRPNLEKLILSGAADTEHISILWYTIPDGSVGLHYHSMTESVYTIAGSQTDAKGVYPTGSLYFNPPGSGHSITDSTGFFILAYASPPDFANTDLIGDYRPVQIDTADPDFETMYPFTEAQENVSVYPVPLDPGGGMSSQFIQSTSLESYEYVGNYLLVLKGSCTIDGTTFAQETLVVATTIETQSYQVSAVEGSSCLALGLSF